MSAARHSAPPAAALFRLVLGFLACLPAAAPAALAEGTNTQALGKFGVWQGFAYSDKAGKVCYATATPKSSLGAPKGRHPVFLSITHRPAAKSFDVVSVSEGFAFKKDAPIEMDIGGAKFDLYSQEETAWTRNDKAVVQALMKGKTVVVHASPAKGSEVADTYALDGFAKAYAEIGKACGVK